MAGARRCQAAQLAAVLPDEDDGDGTTRAQHAPSNIQHCAASKKLQYTESIRVDGNFNSPQNKIQHSGAELFFFNLCCDKQFDTLV